ncbi:MAG: MetQ/NlpA family ABC transporter substrate-binding protein [Bacteroides sp.]
MKNLFKNVFKRVAAGVLSLTLLALTACGVAGNSSANNSDKKELKYGKSQGPYTILFEDAIKPILEAKGYKLTAVDFSELLLNDIALNEGEIDFNVEQHTAYANNFNKSQNGNLVPITPIPTVPAAIFSAKNKSLSAIKDGAKVAVPNDAANTSRAYALLQKAGWIKLNPSVDLSQVKQSDIIENKYNIQFTEMASLNIPAVLDDFDFAVITGSIVYNAGIDPSTALLQEDILEHLILQVVVKEENKDAQWAKDIVAAYHSKEFKEYLDKNNKGLWYVPEELFK